MFLLVKNNIKTVLSLLFVFVCACLLAAPAAYGARHSGPSAGVGPAALRPGPVEAKTADSLDPLRDSLLAFFAPMHGDVLEVKDGLITASIGNTVSVMPGMRLKVLKKGAEFYDPLTGTPVERTELPVGEAFVINGPVSESPIINGPATKEQSIKGPADRGHAGGACGQSTGKPAESGQLIERPASGGPGGIPYPGGGAAAPVQVQMKLMGGQAAAGDIVRLSASRVRLLFYQLKGVSWGLAQKYYNLLKKTGRFDLLASTLDDEKDALAEGRRLKADAVLIISQGILDGKKTGNVFLAQKLLWTSDGSQVLADQAVIKSGQFRKFTFADKFFAPEKKSLTMFNVPYGARFISFFHPFDLHPKDGAPKAKPELLLLASRHDIFFYGISASMLSAALEGAEIKARSWQRFLKIEPADLNGDGADKIIIGAKSSGRIVSYIYGFKDGAFRRLWKGKDLFLRWVGGRLYAQKAGVHRGFEGRVLTARWDERQKQVIPGGAADLPKGVNIFGFSPMKYGGKTIIIAYDALGFINVYDQAGRRVWKSPGSFGGFPASFSKKSYGLARESGRWHIEDGIKVIGRDALFIERQPILKMVSGLGYKDSRIGVLRWDGSSMRLMVLGKRLSGDITDFAATKKSLMVLESPIFGLELGRILKGQSPFTSRLYMYPLEGE